MTKSNIKYYAKPSKKVSMNVIGFVLGGIPGSMIADNIYKKKRAAGIREIIDQKPLQIEKYELYWNRKIVNS